MRYRTSRTRFQNRQLRKTNGLLGLVYSNIATVLGPAGLAAQGTTALRRSACGCLPRSFFFVPGALVIKELSSRFPEEGGLYVWSREAFGPFPRVRRRLDLLDLHRLLISPACCSQAASMAAYILGGRRPSHWRRTRISHHRLLSMLDLCRAS